MSKKKKKAMASAKGVAAGSAGKGSASATPAKGSSSRASASRQDALTLWPILVAGAIVVAAVAVLYTHVHATSAAPQPSPSVFAGDYYPSQGHQGHSPGDLKRFANFRYSSDPPTSGFHREVMAGGFINSAPLPKYVQVHLLEHGNILLQYNCLCPDTVQQLAAIADEFDNRLLPPGTIRPTMQQMQNAEEQGLAVIVAPYPSMSHVIALTAWTRLATMNAVDKGNIVSFINQWQHNQDNLSQ
jgi:hypothetical protein